MAANGQKLRVAVTKTSAQGKAAQSATPNLMSFSTDENSVWFNGKKYGVILLKEDFLQLTTSSSSTDIQAALGTFTFEYWKAAYNMGMTVVVQGTYSSYLGVIMYQVSGSSEYLDISLIDNSFSQLKSIGIEKNDSGYSVVSNNGNVNILSTDVMNDLTTNSADYPLSAAMGKKLQDEKLAKSDVVNNLTTTDTSKALSAAQGKALNDKISALGSVYRVKGSKTDISEVLALTDAKVGDVWNVINAFTLNGKPFPASTNIVCVTATSSSDHDEGNWDPIGGTVDLSPYLSKMEASQNYLKKKDAESTYTTKAEFNALDEDYNSQLDAISEALDTKLNKSDVVDNLTTSSKGKALDASQGVILKEAINTKINAYVLTSDIVIENDEDSLGSDNSTISKILGSVKNLRAAIIRGTVIQGIVLYKSTAYSIVFTAIQKSSSQQVELIGILSTNKILSIRATFDSNTTNWVYAQTYVYVIDSGITIE